MELAHTLWDIYYTWFMALPLIVKVLIAVLLLNMPDNTRREAD